MRKPEAEIREQVWEYDKVRFSLRMARQNTIPKRTLAGIWDMMKIAYQAGLDRGYDMAATIYDPEGTEEKQ